MARQVPLHLTCISDQVRRSWVNADCIVIILNRFVKSHIKHIAVMNNILKDDPGPQPDQHQSGTVKLTLPRYNLGNRIANRVERTPVTSHRSMILARLDNISFCAQFSVYPIRYRRQGLVSLCELLSQRKEMSSMAYSLLNISPSSYIAWQNSVELTTRLVFAGNPSLFDCTSSEHMGQKWQFAKVWFPG